ncbi:hypothetical protein O3M35_008518 [Rhynocoris fuscipes]|uniref:Uncharacterized protein n=1 Tax=Rhynocoris fuscipes TaxID=488301 RepID=A0AAW1DC88_9HEMI
MDLWDILNSIIKQPLATTTTTTTTTIQQQIFPVQQHIVVPILQPTPLLPVLPIQQQFVQYQPQYYTSAK